MLQKIGENTLFKQELIKHKGNYFPGGRILNVLAVKAIAGNLILPLLKKIYVFLRHMILGSLQ